MKLITKNTDYAIQALLYLAKEKDRFVSSREITESNRIPLRFTRRILQDLTRGKIIESREGVTGGVRILKKPKEIRILDLIELFQGRIQISECMFRDKICYNRSTCVIRKQLGVIEQKMAKEFSLINLQTLMNDLQKKTN